MTEKNIKLNIEYLVNDSAVDTSSKKLNISPIDICFKYRVLWHYVSEYLCGITHSLNMGELYTILELGTAGNVHNSCEYIFNKCVIKMTNGRYKTFKHLIGNFKYEGGCINDSISTYIYCIKNFIDTDGDTIWLLAASNQAYCIAREVH